MKPNKNLNNRIRKCFLIDLEHNIFQQTEENIFWRNLSIFTCEHPVYQIKKSKKYKLTK